MPFIIPNVFKAGEKAIAEEINENFNYLKQSLEQINNTLGSRIDSTNSTLGDDIEELNSGIDSIADNLSQKETIVRLGTINSPDPLEDGQIPTAQIELQADRIHSAAILANSEIILPTLEDDDKMVNCFIEFTIDSQSTLALPLNIKWPEGEPPELVADGVTINRFLFDTTSGGDSWCGYFNTLTTPEVSSDEQ